MICQWQKPLKGNSIGIVFGSFAPLHQGHLDVIMRAKKENDGGCIVIVSGYDGDKGEPLMPHNKRYRYVREFFADDDLVAVYGINETEIGAEEYPNGWAKWLNAFENIYRDAVQSTNKRVWYVGEQCYYNDLIKMQEHAVLLNREENLISGTMIRNNPIKHWNQITFPFKRVFSTNVLICGTASEGKSVLTADLGKYFNSPYSTEYARDYMIESCLAEWELDGTDFIAFLDGQYQLNKKKINSKENNGIFFADSDSMVTKMFAKFFSEDSTCAITEKEFEKVSVLADEITAKCKWDKIYVLAPMGDFVDDHERYMAHSNMDDRLKMFSILLNELERSGNWDKVTVLNKGYYENFTTIVKDIKEIMNK